LAYAVVSIWGCASNTEEDGHIWGSTDNIYSAASISSSKAMVSGNGDIVIVWQEQETEVRDDTLKDAAHLFPNTSLAPHTHKHKFLYTRTNVNARRYNSSADSWGNVKALTTGFWQKTKSGTVENADVGDESKIVYTENIDSTFVGDIAVAMNATGDAVAAWVQLAEGGVTGDAGAGYNLFVYQYNSSTSSWSSPLSLTDTVVVQNALDVSLSDNNVAQLVWLGRGSNGKVNAYQNTYDGSTWSSNTQISDGNGTVRDITLVLRNQTSGVAVWTQYLDNAASTVDVCGQTNFNSTPLSLYGNWFNATGWHTTPLRFNDGAGEVNDFSLASNKNGDVWISWAQTSNVAYACQAGLATNQYLVSDVSLISVSRFEGDIDADGLAAGTWSTAQNVQPDIEVTTLVDESALASVDSSIAVDTGGNVVVAWVEKGDAKATPSQRKDSLIRANTYSKTSGSWLMESFIVSDVAKFESSQLIEKTVPNDHIAPKVVSTGLNQFTISWQYWSVSQAASGYQVFSVDYNAETNNSAAMKTVSDVVSPTVTQMDVFSVGDSVQMLWSQETDSGVRLLKSLK